MMAGTLWLLDAMLWRVGQVHSLECWPDVAHPDAIMRGDVALSLAWACRETGCCTTQQDQASCTHSASHSHAWQVTP